MKVSNLGDMLAVSAKALIARRNYARALQRLRQEAPRRKIKVAFFVSELEKWKGQSVFDELKSSSGFDPFVVVMNLPQHKTLPRDEQLRIEEEKAAYFRNRGMPVVRFENDRWTFDADIVFYQQPWGIPRKLKPFSVSRRALTFYFPYYTPNLEGCEFDTGSRFHHLLFRQIVLDEPTAHEHIRCRRQTSGFYAGDVIALGHPAFDRLPTPEDLGPAAKDSCIIYAPHWSIDSASHHPPLPYSTFAWSGREILSFAQAHPNVKWAFKPHPKLRTWLVESGTMTEQEAAEYYRAWESVGEACYLGPESYIELFKRSRAMFTDCGSFLNEYGWTGKRLIHLTSPFVDGLKLSPLYQTYDRVRITAELTTALKQAVRNEDPHRENRLVQLRALQSPGHAADRIVTHLKELLYG